MKNNLLSKMLAVTLASLIMTCISAATQAWETSVTIKPTGIEIPFGEELQLRAYMTDHDGSQVDITQNCKWSSNLPGNISVGNEADNKGLCKAQASSSSAYIKADYGGGLDCTEKYNTGSVPSVVNVRIDPSNPVKVAGQTQQLDAYHVYDDGSESSVTATARWSSNDTSVAKVSAHGLVLAFQPGTAQISAETYKSGQVNFTVIPQSNESIKVTPVDEKLDLGHLVFYKATAISNNGEIGDDITREVEWSSSNHSVANISNAWQTEGMVTVIGYGNTDITAKYLNEGEQLQDTVPLTVFSKSIDYIEIKPDAETAIEGNKIHYKARAMYKSGAHFDVTVLATWLSSDSSIATVGDDPLHKGVVKAKSAGDVEITATHYNVSGSSSLTVDPPMKNLR